MRSALRAKVAGSAVLLLVTAGYHGSGRGGIVSALEAAALPPDLTAILGGVWLFFSWHLAAIAVVALAAAVTGAAWMRPVLLFCGAVLLVDFAQVFRIAGWFPGTVLILLAALGLLVGGYLWRRPE